MSTAHEVLSEIEDTIKAAEAAQHDNNYDDLVADLKRRQKLKTEIKALEDELAFLEEALIKVMPEKVDYDDGDTRVVVTVVRSNTTSVDLDMLRDLDPRVYKAVTKEVIDTAKLNEAKELRLFDEGQPAHGALSLKPRKPFLKYTAKKNTMKEDNA